jgi:RHS repeat-associated protein
VQSSTTTNMRNTWGRDISGSLQGAGGVGGLLMAEELDNGGDLIASHDYCADGNANITHTTSGGGSVKGAFRLSTKYMDHEVETRGGIYYYGYRHYSPELGRWLSRDPIAENGGVNLYAMVGNDAVTHWDHLGLAPTLPNNGLGPVSPFQNPDSNCGGTAVFPNHVAGGNPGQFNPSPENMTRPSGEPNEDGTPEAGCREVLGAADCKLEPPLCERHVVVYISAHQDWEGPDLPNYHAVGQSTCGEGNYYHPTGNGDTIFGPLVERSPVVGPYYTALPEGGPPPPLKETHYCCPNDQ